MLCLSGLLLLMYLTMGLKGDIDDLIAAVAKQFGAKPIAVRTFIKNLEMAGCLTDSKPHTDLSVRFHGN